MRSHGFLPSFTQGRILPCLKILSLSYQHTLSPPSLFFHCSSNQVMFFYTLPNFSRVNQVVLSPFPSFVPILEEVEKNLGLGHACGVVQLWRIGSFVPSNHWKSSSIIMYVQIIWNLEVWVHIWLFNLYSNSEQMGHWVLKPVVNFVPASLYPHVRFLTDSNCPHLRSFLSQARWETNPEIRTWNEFSAEAVFNSVFN